MSYLVHPGHNCFIRGTLTLSVVGVSRCLVWWWGYVCAYVLGSVVGEVGVFFVGQSVESVVFVSWWLVGALGVFFVGVGVYGLVLGSE